MGRASEVNKIVRAAKRDGWRLIEAGKGGHPSLERNGVRIRFSKNPGSDAAVRAMIIRIRKGRQE
jgi:hypothetical protein